MTNVATKNGKLILKDGKIAESCKCCSEVDCDSCISGTGPLIIRVQFTLTANDGMVSFEVPLKLMETVRDGRTNTGGIGGDGRVCDRYAAFWGEPFDLGFAGVGPWPQQVDIPYGVRQLTYTYQGSDTFSGSDSSIGLQITRDVSASVEIEFVGYSGVGLGAPYAPRIAFATAAGFEYFPWAPKPSPFVYYQSALQGGGRDIYYHTAPYQSDGTSVCYANWPGLVDLPIVGGASFLPVRTGTVSLTVNSVE